MIGNCKYQLIQLGDNVDFFKRLKIELQDKFDTLKLNIDLIRFITKDNIHEYTGSEPAYVVFNGGNKNADNQTLDILNRQKSEGNIILPIFENDFTKEIPSILSNYNGLKWDNNLEKIVNLILEGFELLRKSRKIFISYKRSESSNVAIQLYELLEQNNFDVFLDTHSVDKGEDFQEELWHRMTDCDVILMLNTDGFLKSEWCNKELEKAHIKRIGIVHLIWPGCNFEDFAYLAESIQLKTNDFEKPFYSADLNNRLKKDVLPKIVNLIEGVRARNLASRQDSLITDFSQAALNNSIEVHLQYYRYITQGLPSGKNIVYIPTVGIPQSIHCHSSERLIRKIEKKEIESIHLIYDDMSIRDYWLDHLDWLNGYLKIKTIKKINFNKWFASKQYLR